MPCTLRFSEASNLAVHACALLCDCGSGTRMTHRAIAVRLGVSESHLGKVMQKLVHCGILSSERGAAGGFSLSMDPGKVTILDIINCVDPSGEHDGCLLGRPVCYRGDCMLSDLSRKVGDMVSGRLGSTTLFEFARKQLSKRNRKE